MKMLKSKKVLSILLVLVMVFAFSANAFAATPGTVDVVLTISGTPTSYPLRSVDGIDDTVYDVAVGLGLVGDMTFSPAASYSPLLDLNDPLYGLFNSEAVFVTELAGKSAEPYIPAPGSFDEWDEYVGGDDYIDELNADPEYAQYGGIYMTAASMLGEGYFFMGDMMHMCYIGNDITYKVDFAADGIGNPVMPGKPVNDPAYDNYFMYAMNECMLSNGDIVYLNYGPTAFVFSF